MKKAAGYMLYAGFLCLTALGITEGFLRCYPPAFLSLAVGFKGLFQPLDHPVLSFTMKPHYKGSYTLKDRLLRFTTNENGLRGASIEDVRKAPYQMVFLGDSFTLGVFADDEDIFPRVFEKTVQAHYPGLRVLNLGHAYSGPVEYFERYKLVEDRINPTLVVLCFFHGNDWDANPRPYVSDEGMLYRYPPESGSGVQGIVRRLYLYQVYRILEDAYRKSFESDGMAFVQYLFRGVTKRVGVDKLPDERLLYPDAYAWPPFQEVIATMQRLHAYLQARGIPLVVVSLPAMSQVYPEQWVDAGYIASRGLDVRLPSRILGRAMHERGIPFLDVLPLFQSEAAGGKALYNEKEIDQHFNAYGHAVTAGAIRDFLLEHALMRRESPTSYRFRDPDGETRGYPPGRRGPPPR